jgi:2-polyprenyl-6-methoxyphenol hydroxylase-like FAD-dependent oxidoreductase
MARIVVLGAGVCGLAAAMMLSRDGHDVTVLERDPAPVPDSAQEAWERWERGGVTQFRQAHYLAPRSRHVLDDELPDVRDALLAAGGVRLDPLELMPPSLSDTARRAGDERFVTITGRRPTLEHVVARAAEAEPGLEVRRGVAAEELLTTQLDGLPHVTGVRTATGEQWRADLVVDAMGRRSDVPRWLDDAGARPLHEEAEDSGFIYYTRFFRGSEPPQVRAPPLTPLGSMTLLTLPGDNGTWSVTLYISAGDQPLKRLREADAWAAVVGACPLHAHWLDGEPISAILPMGGIADRFRRLMVDGRPVATGLALVADACACTNPSLGRGIALGLLHAQRLRDVVRAHLAEPGEFAEAWDAQTEAELVPWYRSTVREDRDRLRQIDAVRQGLEAPVPADRDAAVLAALPAAAAQDADVFRALLELRGCIGSPAAVLARPGLAERTLELAGNGMTPPIPGPSREQLLSLLATHG